jgi:peptidoglycan/xylan/chitin deacetylase (PgdA/CDA1 family)
MLILNYHRVGPVDPRARYRGMFVSQSHLLFQVELLRLLGYQFCTVIDAVQKKQRGEKTVKLACLTFDDGYLDNFNCGLSILRARTIPATVYVVTKDVGKKNVTWSEAGDSYPSDLMDWDQLRLLQDLGWEIGSHAHDHVHLARRSASAQELLIGESYHVLSEKLGPGPRTFAYPYGSYNQETIALLRNMNCPGAVTIQEGVNEDSAHGLELKRIAMRGYSWRHYPKALQKLVWKP